MTEMRIICDDAEREFEYISPILINNITFGIIVLLKTNLRTINF